MKLASLRVELESNPPVADSQPPLGRIDVRQAHYVAVPRERVTVQRCDDAAPDLRVEPVGVALGARRPDDGKRQGRPQRRFTSSCGIPRPSANS